MEAVVTLKVTPQEFDLIRSALKMGMDEYLDISNDKDATPQVRRTAKERHAQLALLANRLS